MSEHYTSVLLEDIKRTADLCVKCNICTSVCPVVPVTDLFPGPKYVGPQAQRFRDPGLPSPDHSLDYCSGCGVCTLVCPHGVKVMEINTAAKAELRQRQFRENPLNLRWWRNTAFGYNEVLGQVGGTVAPLANARPSRLSTSPSSADGFSRRIRVTCQAGRTLRARQGPKWPTSTAARLS